MDHFLFIIEYKIEKIISDQKLIKIVFEIVQLFNA